MCVWGGGSQWASKGVREPEAGGRVEGGVRAESTLKVAMEDLGFTVLEEGKVGGGCVVCDYMCARGGGGLCGVVWCVVVGHLEQGCGDAGWEMRWRRGRGCKLAGWASWAALCWRRARWVGA
jgi:hypothetical protein